MHVWTPAWRRGLGCWFGLRADEVVRAEPVSFAATHLLQHPLLFPSLPCCVPPPHCHLPATGTQLSRLPVEPMYGKVLLASGEMGCSVEALAVVAMISTDVVFHLPRWVEVWV